MKQIIVIIGLLAIILLFFSVFSQIYHSGWMDGFSTCSKIHKESK